MEMKNYIEKNALTTEINRLIKCQKLYKYEDVKTRINVLEHLLTYIDSMQEEPKKCMYTKDHYTDEDRKVLCDGCEEECEYAQKEEPVSKVWHEPIERPDSNKVVLITVRCGYIGEPEIPHLAKYDSHNNQYIDKDRTDVCNRPIMYHVDSVEKWAYIDDILNLTTKEEHVSEDLDEAAREDAKIERSDDSEVGYDLNRYGGFVAGAKWQKEQMINQIVRGRVIARFPLASDPLYNDVEIYLNFTRGLSEDDKVKVMIIKED